MNLENVKVGDRIKNYKELCKVLGINETGGKSKVLQLENVQRYLRYEMSKREFIILEIYSHEIEKSDKRHLGNSSVYFPHLEFLIMDYLAKQRYNDDFNLIELTVKDIALLTGMCKRDYINKTFEEIKKEHPEITEFDNNDLRRRFESKISRTVDQALKNLSTRYIVVHKGYKIKKKRPNGYGYFWTRATEEEEVKINDVKDEILTDMEIDNIGTVLMKFKAKEFYNKVNDLLNDRFKWDEIYSTYFIGFSNRVDKNVEKFKKSYPALMEQKIELNKKIVKYMDKQADDKYEKNSIEYEKEISNYFGERSPIKSDKEKFIFKYKDNYKDNQKTLSKALLKIEEDKQKYFDTLE
jgi:hypothetical protein